MIIKPLTAVFAIATACVAASASAQSNWYVLGNLGRSSIDADPSAINAYALRSGFTTSSTTTSNDDRGWKAQLGYRFAPMWAVEGGYTSLGEATFTNVNNIGTFVGRKEADLWNLDLVGTFPINPAWAILGRLGGYRWETKSDLPTAAGGTTTSKDDGTNFKYGAGVQYSFNPRFDIRAEYERFHKVGDQNTTGESGVNLFSIGAVLKF